MNKEKAFPKPLRVEVISEMLGVQTEECKNCRLIFAYALIFFECTF
jgi:hypothetical protein